MKNNNHQRSTIVSPITPFPSSTYTGQHSSRDGCGRCGRQFDPGAKFCTRCGMPKPSLADGLVVLATVIPSPWRKLITELISSIPTLILGVGIFLLTFFLDIRSQFWIAGSALLLADLLRDCPVHKRSLGRWLCGTRIISVSGQLTSWQAIARRILPVLAKNAFLLAVTSFIAGTERFHWPKLQQAVNLIKPIFLSSSQFEFALVLFALGYLALSVAWMKINRDGKRLEDHVFDTQVVREADFLHSHKKCIACKMAIPRLAIHCKHCGEKNSPTEI